MVLAVLDSLDLDPRASHDDFATPFLALLYEGLVRFDSTGQVLPAHAESWTRSRTGLTYTFRLRPGRRFEDGSPITARDYTRALGSLFAEQPPSPARARFWCLEGARAARKQDRRPLGVAAPDERTVVFKLTAPDPTLLEKLAQPRYAVPVAIPEREARAGHPLASGPYRLARGAKDQLMLVRNRNYGGDARGFLDSIRVRVGVGMRGAVLGLGSGRVSILYPVPPEYRNRLGLDTRLARVESSEDAAMRWFLALNCELAPVARRLARHAVARAVNRQRVVELLAPLASPWRDFAAGGPAASSAPGFDPMAAQAALEAAHYPRGIPLPIAVPRASLEAAAARSLVSDLGRASVYGEVQAEKREGFYRRLLARRGALASLVSWRCPTSDRLENLAELLLNRSLDETWGGNLFFYRTAGGASLDSLLYRGLRSPGLSARETAAEEVEARLAEDLPFVPVVRVRDLAYCRLEVRGLRFHPRYGLDLAHAWIAR